MTAHPKDDHLLTEHLITCSDALFEGIQEKLGVTDGGLAAMFWSGHPTFEETIKAIRTLAPDFEPTRDQAFTHTIPKLRTPAGTDAEGLRATATEFLEAVGNEVGADLNRYGLVDDYVKALEDYVSAEAELAAPSP